MDVLFHNVSELPEIFSSNRVFICKEDELIVFKCPCGCNDIIKLSTVPDSKPRWSFRPPNTITPSINRTVNCKSHFSIENGKVKFH